MIGLELRFCNCGLCRVRHLFRPIIWRCSSGVERIPHKDEVAGSNPATATEEESRIVEEPCGDWLRSRVRKAGEASHASLLV